MMELYWHTVLEIDEKKGTWRDSKPIATKKISFSDEESKHDIRYYYT
jgi:hypothetical protein